MLDRLFFFSRRDGSIDFVAAETKDDAEKAVGKKSKGFISLSRVFRPEERSAFQLAAAMDLAVEEYPHLMDSTEAAIIRGAAGKIRWDFFE